MRQRKKFSVENFSVPATFKFCLCKIYYVAEEVGFEPTSLAAHAFQACGMNHYPTPPFFYFSTIRSCRVFRCFFHQFWELDLTKAFPNS